MNSSAKSTHNAWAAFKSAKTFGNRLRKLNAELKAKHKANPMDPARSLSQSRKDEIFATTNRRCHVCGGRFTNKRVRKPRWNAPQIDHLLAHSAGGSRKKSNLLGAHRQCNLSRRNFGPEEWRYILKLGIHARREIVGRTELGNEFAESFLVREKRLKKSAESKK